MQDEYPPREKRSDLEWSETPPTTVAEIGAINSYLGPAPIVGATEVE